MKLALWFRVYAPFLPGGLRVEMFLRSRARVHDLPRALQTYYGLCRVCPARQSEG